MNEVGGPAPPFGLYDRPLGRGLVGGPALPFGLYDRPLGRGLVGGPAPLKLHIGCRDLFIHIEKLPPEPLHILIRHFLLLIQKIMDCHLSKKHMDNHKYI